MVDYPINLRLKEKKCLVIGGGQVALRKIRHLYKAGARITVIAPEIHTEIKKLNVTIILRKYENDLQDDYFLVVVASNDRQTNRQIALDAIKKNILINVVDNIDLSSFTFPSVIKRKNLIISISTSGQSPFFTKIFRRKLEKMIKDEDLQLLESLSKERKTIKGMNLTIEQKIKCYRNILNKERLSPIQNQNGCSKNDSKI